MGKGLEVQDCMDASKPRLKLSRFSVGMESKVIELVQDPDITVSIVSPTLICGGHAAHTGNNNIIGEAQEQFIFANGVSLVRDTNK